MGTDDKSKPGYWTSLEAYQSILPELPKRRIQVLEALLEYLSQFGENPTSRELADCCSDGDLDHPTIHKRLPELMIEDNACHQDEPRTCAVSGNKAVTWAPGPGEGRTFGQRQLGRHSLKFRLALLLKRSSYLKVSLDVDELSVILGVSKKRIKDLVV